MLAATCVTGSQIITQSPIIIFFVPEHFFVAGTFFVVRAINKTCFEIKKLL